MRKVRRFHFTLTIYLTDTYGGVCLKKNATALLFSCSLKGLAIARLLALLLPCFNIK